MSDDVTNDVSVEAMITIKGLLSTGGSVTLTRDEALTLYRQLEKALGIFHNEYPPLPAPEIVPYAPNPVNPNLPAIPWYPNTPNAPGPWANPYPDPQVTWCRTHTNTPHTVSAH